MAQDRPKNMGTVPNGQKKGARALTQAGALETSLTTLRW